METVSKMFNAERALGNLPNWPHRALKTILSKRQDNPKDS